MLTREDAKKIQDSSEKVSTKRNIGFSKLVGHAEKGKRINHLKIELASILEPEYSHEPEYKGIEFTRGDGNSALNMSASFIGNILEYLSTAVKKNQT